MVFFRNMKSFVVIYIYSYVLVFFLFGLFLDNVWSDFHMIFSSEEIPKSSLPVTCWMRVSYFLVRPMGEL